MRKLIKKILRESDDLDWIRDTEPNIGNYFIPGHVYEIGDKIYRFKEFDPNRQGPIDVHLGTDHYGLVVFEDVTPIDPEFMPFLKNQPIRTAIWTVRTMQQIYDDGLVKDITNINESEDFDWIKNAEWWQGFTLGDLYDNNKINVGDKIHVNGYTRGEDGDDTYIDSYVEITDVPNREWGYDGLEYIQFKTDRQTLNNILKGQLGRTLNFTNNDRDLKVLDYQSKINESEEDPFKWIRDTQPINYEYLKGKALHFQPLIDNGRDLNRILDYLRKLGFEVGFGLEDYVFEEESDLEGLYLNPKNNTVTWSPDSFSMGEDYEEHISEWAGIPVEVLDGWETLKDYI